MPNEGNEMKAPKNERMNGAINIELSKLSGRLIRFKKIPNKGLANKVKAQTLNG